MKKLIDIPDIHIDLETLLSQDKLFSKYDISLSDISWRMFEPDFQGLTRTLQSQQISYKVANILWDRLKDLVEGNVTPEFFLSLDEKTRKYTGFTRQKSGYMNNLCKLILEKEFNPNEWSHLSDHEIIEKITSLKGFGLWSAQVFMLFSLGRRNILPAKDLVLDNALQKMFQLNERPSYEKVLALTSRWEGRLSAVTLLLWHLYIEKKI